MWENKRCTGILKSNQNYSALLSESRLSKPNIICLFFFDLVECLWVCAGLGYFKQICIMHVQFCVFDAAVVSQTHLDRKNLLINRLLITQTNRVE